MLNLTFAQKGVFKYSDSNKANIMPNAEEGGHGGLPSDAPSTMRLWYRRLGVLTNDGGLRIPNWELRPDNLSILLLLQTLKTWETILGIRHKWDIDVHFCICNRNNKISISNFIICDFQRNKWIFLRITYTLLHIIYFHLKFKLKIYLIWKLVNIFLFLFHF